MSVWIVSETEGATAFDAEDFDEAWAAYQESVGEPVEYDTTEYGCRALTAQDFSDLQEHIEMCHQMIHKLGGSVSAMLRGEK